MLKEQEFPGCRPGPKRVGEEQKWKMRQGVRTVGRFLGPWDIHCVHNRSFFAGAPESLEKIS